jgi:tight adherence protein B
MQFELILIAGFAAAAFAVIAFASVISDLFLFRREQLDERLAEEFGLASSKAEVRSPLFKDMAALSENALSSRYNWRLRIVRLIDQSGLPLTFERLFLLCVGISLTAILIGLSFQIPLLFAALLLPTGPLVLAAAIMILRQRRIEKLRMQLPDAFEFVSRAVSSGQTLSAAFELAGDNCQAPLAEEFALAHEQMGLGLPQETVLRELARRTGVIEMQMFVVTMLVQKQSGGSPVEILNNLCTVVRKRTKLQGKIKSLTAEGRTQALVLLLLPPVLALALFFLNRSHIDALVARPQMVMGMIGFECVGAFFIRRIVNFSY